MCDCKKTALSFVDKNVMTLLHNLSRTPGSKGGIWLAVGEEDEGGRTYGRSNAEESVPGGGEYRNRQRC